MCVLIRCFCITPNCQAKFRQISFKELKRGLWTICDGLFPSCLVWLIIALVSYLIVYTQCENCLKTETSKFQAVYEKFCKDQANHLQALKGISYLVVSKYETSVQVDCDCNLWHNSSRYLILLPVTVRKLDAQLCNHLSLTTLFVVRVFI